MFDVPPFTDFYLLQFTLSGWCQIWQDKTYTVLPAGSVAIVNPFLAFKKAWISVTEHNRSRGGGRSSRIVRRARRQGQ